MGIRAVMRLIKALNPLFIHVNLPRLSQGRTQGRPKCALDSLAIAKCLHPQNMWRQRRISWLQKLAIAILLVDWRYQSTVTQY